MHGNPLGRGAVSFRANPLGLIKVYLINMRIDSKLIKQGQNYTNFFDEQGDRSLKIIWLGFFLK
jgi:hypothetical protein